MCRVSRKFIKELPTMKLITESTLFVLLLCCCCCLTVNARCWVECPKSQKGLSEPECFLKDDGKSNYCSKHILGSDLTGQSISVYKHVTLMLDLTSTVQSLYIWNKLGDKLKISTSSLHSEIKQLGIYDKYAEVQNDLFYMLPKLANLNLNEVKFQYFPRFSGSNPLLTFLSVSAFSFVHPRSYHSVLRKGRVSDLPLLNFLKLSSDQLLNTKDDSFSGLTALTALYLKRIYLPNPVDTLSPLVKLNTLGYQQSELDDISFLSQTSSLFGLTHLSFDRNKITHIPTDVFSNYANLKELNLNRNKITALEKDWFKGLDKLRELFLKSNQLKKLSATAFRGLDSVDKIYLGGNSISHLSSRAFEYLSQLQSIYLSNLPLHCDCGLQWMSKAGLSIHNPRCATPPQHSGKPATDPSIYVDCTQELSYQCFDRSNSCPTGSYCHDTIGSYTCVCEEENHYFVKPLNKCIGLDKLMSCG